MPNDPLRLGVIGAGGIFQQRHGPGFRELDGVELVAVSNRGEDSSRAAAEAWGFARVEMDWRAIVAADDVDAVVIGTWPYTHREMSVAALDAGKHVFCQARMAMDLPEAEAMVAAARRNPGLVPMLCPPPHRMPYEPYVRSLLDGGTLGELREASLVCVDGGGLGPLTWRERVELSGRQALQVGIWAEALNAWLGDYETLSATTATPLATKPDPDAGDAAYDIAVPQVVLVHGTLVSGLTISERHSGVSPHEARNDLTVVGSARTLRVRIVGGHMQVDLAEPGGDFAEVEPRDALTRGWRVERDFVEAVRAARRGEAWRVSPDFDEGLRYMKKVDAIHRSTATGAAVHL